jgi:hypothetical protein
MNQIFDANYPVLFPWKGQTFQQISSSIKKNAKVNATVKLSVHNLMMPNPLKIYRREIANTFDMSSCNLRTSLRIDELDRPNGSLVYSAPVKYNTNGLASTLDINLTSNKYERPGSCSSCTTGNNALSLEQNALRRVRSSGMIKRQFDVANNNTPTYYTNTAQYLKARNINFEQNQYNYIRMGNANVKPGSTASIVNLYTANGLTKCKKYYIATDTSFGYTWVDNITKTVTISAGYYDVDDINTVFKQAMINNGHYYYANATYVKSYLMNIVYNSYYSKIELQIFATNNYPTNTGIYSQATGGTSWVINRAPTININANAFSKIIGYLPGTYTITSPSASNSYSFFSSTSIPLVGTKYIPLHYKPKNSQFGQQGAVSASSLITRIKYDSITTTAGLYTKSIGSAVANALAYGTKDSTYTLKDKIGYPLKLTPIINKYNGKLSCCKDTKITGGL